MNHADIPPISTARLPGNYIAALEALRLCAKRFTPEGYLRATIALEASEALDECASSPQDLHMLASYGRIANDNSMERLVRRVEKKRAAWKVRRSVVTAIFFSYK